tara:strand:+ start:871 stop:1026 length:156 start_codon:yes stop_codon:yes gene_type:complete
MEDVNAAMVEVYNRLQSRDGIMAVMAEFGVTTLTELDASKYQELVDKVKGL